jgi:hypothetical protein
MCFLLQDYAERTVELRGRIAFKAKVLKAMTMVPPLDQRASKQVPANLNENEDSLHAWRLLSSPTTARSSSAQVESSSAPP